MKNGSLKKFTHHFNDKLSIHTNVINNQEDEGVQDEITRKKKRRGRCASLGTILSAEKEDANNALIVTIERTPGHELWKELDRTATHCNEVSKKKDMD
ncbi:hypothetical protein NECAME_06534, partial [Necator americanus]